MLQLDIIKKGKTNEYINLRQDFIKKLQDIKRIKEENRD